MNNAITNLRWVTQQENCMNKERRDDVNIIMRRGSFAVDIGRHRQRHYLGLYATIEAARAARDVWIAEHPD